MENSDWKYHDDLLDVLIEKKVVVPLNKDYEAVISKDCVVVGCQTFTHESILNLNVVLVEYMKDLKNK